MNDKHGRQLNIGDTVKALRTTGEVIRINPDDTVSIRTEWGSVFAAYPEETKLIQTAEEQ